MMSPARAPLPSSLILAVVLAAAGCAGGPGNVPGLDPAEASRARAALAAFEALAQTEERYGVWVGGRRAGHMRRERTTEDDRLVTVSRLVDERGARGSDDLSTTLTEAFSATPPHDVVLLEERGRGDTRRIRLTDQGYVAEFNRGPEQYSEPLFDFQYRLADALAPQVWLLSDAALSECLSYPGYSLRRFARRFTTECVTGPANVMIDGAEVEAIETLRRDRSRVVRERSNGRELINQVAPLGIELRLEPRGLTTRLERDGDARPGPGRGTQIAGARTVRSQP